MLIYHSQAITWDTRSEGEETTPTTPSTAHFEPIQEQHQSAAAAPLFSEDEEDTIEKLMDWIDYPPVFKQNDNTSPVYLFKAEFTFPILMEGLIYAVSKYKALVSEFRFLSTIAMRQYNQDISEWRAQYGLGSEWGFGTTMKNVCLREEIESENWEIELRNTELTEKEKRLLRRTIVAVAKMVEKFEVSNYDMKVGIAILQGDIEPESEED